MVEVEHAGDNANDNEKYGTLSEIVITSRGTGDKDNKHIVSPLNIV